MNQDPPGVQVRHDEFHHEVTGKRFVGVSLKQEPAITERKSCDAVVHPLLHKTEFCEESSREGMIFATRNEWLNRLVFDVAHKCHRSLAGLTAFSVPYYLPECRGRDHEVQLFRNPDSSPQR